MKSGIECQVLRDLASVDAIKEEWSQLCRRCPRISSFQRPEWLLPWMRVFSPSQIVFLAVRKELNLVAVAPLQMYGEPPQKTVGFMGGGLSDYLDVVVHPDFASESLSCIYEAMHSDPSWDLMQLTDLPESSQFLQSFQQQALATPASNGLCQIIEVDPNARTLSDVVPFGKYKGLRNARSRLRRAGESSIQIATANTVQESLTSLFHLHQRRWSESGSQGVLNDRQVQAFHRLAAPLLLAEGVLRLYTLCLNGNVIAALYSMFERDTAYLYIHGLDPDFRHLSPGAILFAKAIEDAMKEGLKRVDFLRGQEPYKAEWGCQGHATYSLQAARGLAPRHKTAA